MRSQTAPTGFVLRPVYATYLGIKEVSVSMKEMFDSLAVVWTLPLFVAVAGCILLFRAILKKRRRRVNPPPNSAGTPDEKRGLTPDEKQALAEKIRKTGTENLKKSFAGEDNTVAMVLATIGLLILTFLWVLWLIHK